MTHFAQWCLQFLGNSVYIVSRYCSLTLDLLKTQYYILYDPKNQCFCIKLIIFFHNPELLWQLWALRVCLRNFLWFRGGIEPMSPPSFRNNSKLPILNNVSTYFLFMQLNSFLLLAGCQKNAKMLLFRKQCHLAKSGDELHK